MEQKCIGPLHYSQRLALLIIIVFKSQIKPRKHMPRLLLHMSLSKIIIKLKIIESILLMTEIMADNCLRNKYIIVVCYGQGIIYILARSSFDKTCISLVLKKRNDQNSRENLVFDTRKRMITCRPDVISFKARPQNDLKV